MAAPLKEVQEQIIAAEERGKVELRKNAELQARIDGMSRR
jgi:hypothetical protein